MNEDGETIEPTLVRRSWSVSVVLHAAVWGLCWWITSQQVITPSSMFQWEVSLVSLSRASNTDALSSHASMQADNQIRSVVTNSVRQSAAAASSAQPVINRTEVAQEPVLSEPGDESDHSLVPRAMRNSTETDHPMALPSTDLATPPQTVGESQSVVDGEEQGPSVSNVRSVGVVDQRAGSSTDSSIDGPASSSTVTHGSSSGSAPDFGWLMQMLWSRVTELKLYPPEARMNRWEGRVVVRVVIDEQGRLVDAAVATGSGHALLDHAALDVIRRSCPLSLPHALGRRQIVLRVPIQYKLDS